MTLAPLPHARLLASEVGGIGAFNDQTRIPQSPWRHYNTPKAILIVLPRRRLAARMSDAQALSRKPFVSAQHEILAQASQSAVIHPSALTSNIIAPSCALSAGVLPRVPESSYHGQQSPSRI